MLSDRVHPSSTASNVYASGAMRPVVHKSGSLCVFRMYGRKYDLLAQARMMNSRLCAPVLPTTRGIWKSMKASWPIYANRSAPPATGRARFSPSRSKERVSSRRPAASVIRSKAANGGQVKTGQRRLARDVILLAHFLLVRQVRFRAPAPWPAFQDVTVV